MPSCTYVHIYIYAHNKYMHPFFLTNNILLRVLTFHSIPQVPRERACLIQQAEHPLPSPLTPAHSQIPMILNWVQLSCFTDGQTEAQSEEVTCPRSFSQLEAKRRIVSCPRTPSPTLLLSTDRNGLPTKACPVLNRAVGFKKSKFTLRCVDRILEVMTNWRGSALCKGGRG